MSPKKHFLLIFDLMAVIVVCLFVCVWEKQEVEGKNPSKRWPVCDRRIGSGECDDFTEEIKQYIFVADIHSQYTTWGVCRCGICPVMKRKTEIYSVQNVETESIFSGLKFEWKNLWSLFRDRWYANVYLQYFAYRFVYWKTGIKKKYSYSSIAFFSPLTEYIKHKFWYTNATNIYFQIIHIKCWSNHMHRFFMVFVVAL